MSRSTLTVKRSLGRDRLPLGAAGLRRNWFVASIHRPPSNIDQRAPAQTARVKPNPQIDLASMAALAFDLGAVSNLVQTRFSGTRSTLSSILPSAVSLRSAPLSCSTAVLHLRSAVAAARSHRCIPFDHTLMHSIESGVVSIAFSSHPIGKKSRRSTLKYAPLRRHWFACTIASLML